MERDDGFSRAVPALAVLSAVIIGLLAIGLPLLASALADEPEPHAAESILRIARISSDLPPVRMRITEAEVVTGPRGEPRIVSARVHWHTIFNVEYGTSEIDGDVISNQFRVERAAITWLAFIAVEGTLLGVAAIVAMRR